MIEESVFAKLITENQIWGVLLLDLKLGVVDSANSKSESMIGASMSPLVGRSIADLFSIEGRVLENTDFFMIDGFYGEVLLRRENESLMPVQVTVKIIQHQNSDYCLLSIQDLSAQKKMQRDLLAKHNGLKEVLNELTLKNQELQVLDKAKDKFLSLVAHELRTPLNTLVATSDVIFYEMYKSEDEFKLVAKNLFEQAHQMLILVNDILDLTKIQSGLLEYYIDQFDIAETIHAQKCAFLQIAEQRGIKIVFEAPAERYLCYFDPLRLNQVLSNLLSNAIKFNRKNGEVKISLSKNDDFVEVCVSDCGRGVAGDKFEAIFNEFETIESLANHHKGTGLGLPIAKKLIKGQGGQIWLDSQLGVGSNFHVSIPRARILSPELYRSRKEDGGFVIF